MKRVDCEGVGDNNGFFELNQRAGDQVDRPIIMSGVAEYLKEEKITIFINDDRKCSGYGREVICAESEGGYHSIQIDLEQLLDWFSKNRPEQYAKFITESMMRLYT